LKQWVQKLFEQLDYKGTTRPKISEDRATLLYIIDIYNKHLVDLDTHPVRKVREVLDQFTKELMATDSVEAEKVMFRFRQYFSSYRVAEYTYIRKNFEDFKGIIWNFVEHLSEDFKDEEHDESEVRVSLEGLKEAVDADSIDLLRAKSREFINHYLQHQSKREVRRTKRMKGIKKNLDLVKKQLVEADRSMHTDHLTSAYNRRSFDEQIKQQHGFFQIERAPVSLVIMDIDHFKKVNDTYGHDTGDFILKECVRLLQEGFGQPGDFVARIGGEEFAALLPSHTFEQAAKRCDEVMARIRKEVFVKDNMELRFTISMGIAQLENGETTDQWLRRSDGALYQSKHGGRNRYTVAQPTNAIKVA
jgi:diguanylate cyclase